MTYYERNLPHWHPEGKAIFLTWRLFGSLPKDSSSHGEASLAGIHTLTRPVRSPAVLRGTDTLGCASLLDARSSVLALGLPKTKSSKRTWANRFLRTDS